MNGMSHVLLEINDHPTIQIIFDVWQKNFREFVVGYFPIAVAVGIYHGLVHNLLQLCLLVNK